MARNKSIPIGYIENYSKSLNVISEQARANLVEALSKLDYSADIADIRNEVIAIMQLACGASSTVAARLAAEFYNGLRKHFILDVAYTAVANSMFDQKLTSESVRAFMQVIVNGGDSSEFIDKCAERIDYETRRAANECVAYNARKDPAKPRWARVPTGDDTCAYCMILASRGFSYGSEEMASHTHLNCDCRVVPSWSDEPIVEGYQGKLKGYKDLYDELEKMRNSKDMPKELRMRIASARNKHKADFKAGRTKRKWSNMNELTIIARWLYPGLH